MATTPTDRLNEFVVLAFGGRAAAFAQALGWQRGSVYKYLSGARLPGKAFLVDIERLGGSAAYIREGRGAIYAENAAGEALRARIETTAPRASEHQPGYTVPTEQKRARRLPLIRITLSAPAGETQERITFEELLAEGARAPAVVLFESQALVVDRGVSPQSGEVVLATVGDRTVLRRYRTRRKTPLLAPMNEGEEEILLLPDVAYTLIGVVRAICTLTERR